MGSIIIILIVQAIGIARVLKSYNDNFLSESTLLKPIRHIFLSEYDVRKHSQFPSAPRGTDFTIPQLEFCCSKKCFHKFSEKFKLIEPDVEELMEIVPAE